jgi:tetratricopeptide (TPR) repeat protein
MNEDKTFYTGTMAKLLADQGKIEEAAKIYRYLLEQSPDNPELRQALEKISHRLPDLPEHWERITPLIEQWGKLILKQKELLRLQGLRLKKKGNEKIRSAK